MVVVVLLTLVHQHVLHPMSLLVISSELEEIKSIADRIIVRSNGIKTAELSGDEITEDGLVMASYEGHNSGKKN